MMTALKILVSIAVLLICCGCGSSIQKSNEVLVFRFIREIQTSQVRYRATHHRFGSLDELIKAQGEGEILTRLTRQISEHYHLSLDAGSNRYRLWVTLKPGASGYRRSFYADQSGTVHEADNRQAGPEDPIVR